MSIYWGPSFVVGQFKDMFNGSADVSYQQLPAVFW